MFSNEILCLILCYSNYNVLVKLCNTSNAMKFLVESEITRKKGRLPNGRLHGKHKNSSLSDAIRDEGQKNNQNQNKKNKTIIKNYVDGNLHGEYKKYENGLLISYKNYKHGKRHGFCISYYPQGRKSRNVHKINCYKNGKKYWEQKEYNSNGVLMKSCNYKSGKLHGTCTKYYKNGNIKSTSQYYNGNLHGLSVYYDNIYELTHDDMKFSENTYVDYICSYKQGKKTGKYIKYYTNNKPEIIAFYKNDLLNGKYMEFELNGELISEKEYIDNILVEFSKV